ncbi:HotDog domain-containing protein [Cladochytrium replicatum]|nr:HotDog domain-containing protein [Cladochytrium replicatum]
MDQDPPGAIKIGTDGTVSPASDAPVDMQRPLIPKRMKDSYVEEFLPFKSEPQVKEEYVNVYGGIRIGKILEDLDALSGSVAYSHCDDHEPYTPPMRIVTASVDRIDLLSPIPPDVDVRLSGYVSYVGSSSMEVSLSMETVPGGIVPTEDGFTMINPEEKGVPILAAKFTMVARDPYTNKATKVNPLRLETDEERKIFRLGAEHKARKQVAAQTSLSKTPPSVEEMFLVHDLYLNSMKYMDREYAEPKPNDVIWMTDTAKESFTLCMPQDRNIHNFIFGGYLMRLAYELAYVDALAFSKSRPYFIALDDIIFRKPVPIGSVLHLKAQIVYSSNLSEPSKNANTFQVSVRATVEDPLTGTREHTNTFHFTFATKAECAQVLPRSYDESMQFIEGKRRLVYQNGSVGELLC